ncbi:MAG TPA: flagellar basal body P-ring protein FlgI [Tepidisphaeraceae bacterium]|jgi:flagellar P-ring protein precursor FlgI
MRTNKSVILFTILCSLAAHATEALAVKVADITRLSGQRSNVLTGLGLVYGLKGTGDGGEFSAAINPLREMLAKFADPVTVRELANAKNVAVVGLTATIPANGVRNGDHIDIHVTSFGAASTLKGGRLFVTPMQGPIPGAGILALAEGPLVLEDPSDPNVAIVKGGAVMEVDLPAKSIENGRFTLVLDEPSASFTMASTIAKIINESQGDDAATLAVVEDQKNIVVTIPASEREHPDSFISRVQRLPVPLMATEARVMIDERAGMVTLTGDVEISPVVISYKGLTISTITPTPVGTARNPVVSTKDVVALDTTNQGGAKLQDLTNALDQLRVPADDRIVIVKQLYQTGKLHAKLYLNGVRQ